MANPLTSGNVPTIEVLAERISALSTALERHMETIDNRLTHMEKVLVARPDFDRLRWEFDKHCEDNEKRFSAMHAEFEAKSVGKMWAKFTTFAAGLSGVIALGLTLWGMKQ